MKNIEVIAPGEEVFIKVKITNVTVGENGAPWYEVTPVADPSYSIVAKESWQVAYPNIMETVNQEEHDIEYYCSDNYNCHEDPDWWIPDQAMGPEWFMK